MSAPPSKNCGVLAPLLSAVLSLMHAGFPLLWPQIQSRTPTTIRCAWNSHPPGSCDRRRRTLGLRVPQLPGVSPSKPAKPRAPAPCPDTPGSRSSHPAPECALFLPRLLGQGPTSHPVFGDRHVGVVPEPSALSPSSRAATASVCHVTTERVPSHSGQQLWPPPWAPGLWALPRPPF